MGTFSYPERSHTVHSKVLKPSLWNRSPWRCKNLHDSTKQFILLNTPLSLGESTTNYRESWWGSLDNPSLHKSIKNIVGCVLHLLLLLLLLVKVFTVSFPLEEEGGESSLKINWFQGNTSWPLVIRWFPFDWGKKKVRVNNNIFCLPLQTPQSGGYLLPHESLFIIGEVCRKGRGRGPWLCTWCGFFLLVWSQLCPDLPLPQSAGAPLTQAEPREEQRDAPPRQRVVTSFPAEDLLH